MAPDAGSSAAHDGVNEPAATHPGRTLRLMTPTQLPFLSTTGRPVTLDSKGMMLCILWFGFAVSTGGRSGWSMMPWTLPWGHSTAELKRSSLFKLTGLALLLGASLSAALTTSCTRCARFAGRTTLALTGARLSLAGAWATTRLVRLACMLSAVWGFRVRLKVGAASSTAKSAKKNLNHNQILKGLGCVGHLV